jgi:outer membrane translocation and assembly module TamA
LSGANGEARGPTMVRPFGDLKLGAGVGVRVKSPIGPD